VAEQVAKKAMDFVATISISLPQNELVAQTMVHPHSTVLRCLSSYL
jgi:hypothetical protein